MSATTARADHGQAAILLVGVLAAVLLAALVLGGVARGLGAHADAQRAADLGALAGARAMHDAYADVFAPPTPDGAPDPRHVELATYLARARQAAIETARRNGAAGVAVAFGHADRPAFLPLRITVTVSDPIAVGAQRVASAVSATAELAPPLGAGLGAEPLEAGQYSGPLAYRQGRPMRPDVARAFDRLAAAAGADGVRLVVVSGFRSDGEQAALFAAHPDPRWVAPPGRSLHRLGTELDLGPPAAYAWLNANAPRFHFIRRYAWEPWHWGMNLNAGTTAVGYSADRRTILPAFVPKRYEPAIARAAQHWNVSAALLAAQIQQESGFNPFATSPVGAQGISQFMPGTAHLYGLRDPYDPERAIDAQGHMMRDLLRRFGSVPLALAAYNAGERRVAGCGCIPPVPETQAYVAAILGLLHGAGDPAGSGAAALEIRLVA